MNVRRGRTAEDIVRQQNHDALADWLGAVSDFTALHWACESRDAGKLRALLRQDGSDLQARVRGARHTPLQLAQTSGPPVNAPVSEAVLAMTRAALSPWEPAAHGVWPLSFSRGARALMLVSRRLVTPV